MAHCVSTRLSAIGRSRHPYRMLSRSWWLRSGDERRGHGPQRFEVKRAGPPQVQRRAGLSMGVRKTPPGLASLRRVPADRTCWRGTCFRAPAVGLHRKLRTSRDVREVARRPSAEPRRFNQATCSLARSTRSDRAIGGLPRRLEQPSCGSRVGRSRFSQSFWARPTSPRIVVSEGQTAQEYGRSYPAYPHSYPSTLWVER